MDVLLEAPHPPPLRNVTHFFRLRRGSGGIIYLAVLGLSDVYKSLNVHLGQGQDLMSIQIYLKYK